MGDLAQISLRYHSRTPPKRAMAAEMCRFRNGTQFPHASLIRRAHPHGFERGVLASLMAHGMQISVARVKRMVDGGSELNRLWRDKSTALNGRDFAVGFIFASSCFTH